MAVRIVGGGTALFKGAGFTVSVTTVETEMVVDCDTLVLEADVGATEAELSSGPGLIEAEVEGGTGAFLFLC